MHISMLPLKAYVFSEQWNQTPIKTDGPGYSASQNTSATVSSEICIQSSFKAAGWYSSPIDYSIQDLTNILILSESSKDANASRKQEAIYVNANIQESCKCEAKLEYRLSLNPAGFTIRPWLRISKQTKTPQNIARRCDIF